jgi:hypothetical protein
VSARKHYSNRSGFYHILDGSQPFSIWDRLSRNRLEALGFELWQVICNRIVEALDKTLGDRDPHQG